MRVTVIRRFSGVLGVLAVMTFALYAQAPRPDYSKVKIKTTKISDNLYTLEGEGGTVGVLAGPDGILMVDDQFAPLSEKLVAAIRQISDRPIRFLVNTHLHSDHTGGNENFGKMGVTILAREQVRNRLMRPTPGAEGTSQIPAPAVALPILTFDSTTKIHMNGEEVQLIPVPLAHTDGDTMVRFVKADVIMTGDFYRSVPYPNIDRLNGGTLPGMLDGLGEIIAHSGPNTRIIAGHGPTVDRSTVIAHRDMIVVIRDRVKKLIQEGKSQDEVIAAKPTASFDANEPAWAARAPRFLAQLYTELKSQ